MKVLVLGITGMLGHMVYEYFDERTDFETVGYTKDNLNALNDYDTLYNIFNNSKPDYVINCIGLIHNHVEKDLHKTFIINSAFPHMIADIGNKIGFKLIHISSDCAFDNTIYGKSKLAGEVNSDIHLTIRTSIIGPELNPQGTGLFNWFMNNLDIKGYDVLWDGVTTLELTEFILYSINNELTGIIDYRSTTTISKYELLLIIKEIFKTNHNISKTSLSIPSRCNDNADAYCNHEYFLQILRLEHWIKNHKKLYGERYEV